MAKPIIWMPTRQTVRRVLGGTDGLYPFLEWLGVDTISWWDDFFGDLFYGGAAPGVYQSTASGTSAVAAAIDTGLIGGAIKFDAGSDDNGRSDLSLGLHWSGELSAVVAVRIKLSAITAIKCEVGFTDVVSGTDAGAVNVKATPTWTATDAAVWCLDTDDNTNWEGVAVKNGTTATTVEAAISPTADTYETLVVALRDTDAYYLRLAADGTKNYQSAVQTGAITGTIKLTPWVFLQNRSATQRTANIDYVGVWSRRTT